MDSEVTPDTGELCGKPVPGGTCEEPAGHLRHVETRRGIEVPEVLERAAAMGDPDADVDLPDPFMETPEQAAERRARQTAGKRARWDERVPDDYRAASLDDFPEPLRSTLRRAWSDVEVRNLVIAGPYGVGKTHAAYALGALAVEQGYWVEAWTVRDLMKQMLPDGNPVLMEKRARDCAVLILDDLGATKPSPFAIETLTGILDHRVSRRGRRTIVTTNATEDDLRKAWEDRLVERLRHRLAPIVLTGESRRKPAW